ncbi:hypothetical protein BDCR2A_00826 [Borrelia duttonii CR2A]|uniref:Uncharacterized protein n=5 Tax=Borrelia TaxID=138 RepID=W6TJI5_9SPIR|nr:MULTISPECIES: hypothetical protein [Borrelia]ACH93606.1 uncharacterized conserved protein [Borrelia duttonii Ly]ACH94900.1 hypothetical protein BRE_680 [Borrelia recurrentis A1]AFI31462.1 hypothetical protein Q7M_683 [Borrelia crocidurae str. Achema]ETZ18853.1 hypothetical protein BDCR2A_00826 [Borrelia duttonii CR2A]
MVKIFSNFFKAILIASIFTFLMEELSIILFLPYKIRFALIFIGFLFDIILILIFLYKILKAFFLKKSQIYIRNNLFFDLIHCLVPLIFYSSHQMQNILNPQEIILTPIILSLFKLRFLRLLRFNDLMIEIYYNPKEKNLILIAFARTFSISSLVPFIFFIIFSSSGFANTIPEKQEFNIIKNISITTEKNYIKEKYPFILIIKDKEQTIYSKSDDIFFYYSPSEYKIIEIDKTKFYIDKYLQRKNDSVIGIFLFTLFISFAIFLTNFYKFFKASFLNPIILMHKVLQDPFEYRKIQIPFHFSEEKVYEMAKTFNNVLLKNKLNTKRKSKLPLEIEQLKKIINSNNKENI